MRIVILCEVFAPDMGYLNNTLPKYLARAGADVHVVSLGLPPYYNATDTPAFVTAQALRAGTLRSIDGFQLHVIEFGQLGRYPYAKGLSAQLSSLRPDIVYSITAIGALPLQAALLQPRFGYALFTGNHTSAEAFPLARQPHATLSRARLQAFATRWVPGRLVSLLTQRCYCRTAGCGEIATRYFGVQRRKIAVVHLGVDTDYFFPAANRMLRARRAALRSELGFAADDIVAINTGRMIPSKDLPLLADAVKVLRKEGLPFRALFIGDGPDQARLQASEGCVVLPFRPFRELGDYYRAADIGVWPAGESTSMFDAAACGLPLIVNEGIDAQLDGNGLSIRGHDRAALIATLRALVDPGTRERMGALGARLMHDKFDLEHIAAIRLRDFTQAREAR